MKSQYLLADKIALLARAWELNAKDYKFAGMTLAEFNEAVAPALAVRASIADKRTQLRAEILARALADKASQDLVNRVVYGIMASAEHGANSPIYRSLEYVPTSERRTGMVRKNSQPADSATGVTVPTA